MTHEHLNREYVEWMAKCWRINLLRNTDKVLTVE